MSHIVRCRGDRPWWICLDVRGFGACWPGRKDRVPLAWNGLPAEEGEFAWPARPSWLPVAWLCCEADPEGGPKFAAAILDAESGDDVPALIACERLEEAGAIGSYSGRKHHREGRSRGIIPADWVDEPAPGSRKVGATGLLASWCRELVASRCAGCGGRRDGEDILRATVKRKPSSHSAPSIRLDPSRDDFESFFRRDSLEEHIVISSQLCSLCGFHAFPEPPLLVIPEVVK